MVEAQIGQGLGQARAKNERRALSIAPHLVLLYCEAVALRPDPDAAKHFPLLRSSTLSAFGGFS